MYAPFLSSKEAIIHLMEVLGYPSYYSIAKELSAHDMSVQPIQISDYHKGKRVMSEKLAEHFYTVFGIEISDAYHSKGRPSEW